MPKPGLVDVHVALQKRWQLAYHLHPIISDDLTAQVSQFTRWQQLLWDRTCPCRMLK